MRLWHHLLLQQVLALLEQLSRCGLFALRLLVGLVVCSLVVIQLLLLLLPKFINLLSYFLYFVFVSRRLSNQVVQLRGLLPRRLQQLILFGCDRFLHLRQLGDQLPTFVLVSCRRAHNAEVLLLWGSLLFLLAEQLGCEGYLVLEFGLLHRPFH